MGSAELMALVAGSFYETCRSDLHVTGLHIENLAVKLPGKANIEPHRVSLQVCALSVCICGS